MKNLLILLVVISSLVFAAGCSQGGDTPAATPNVKSGGDPQTAKPANNEANAQIPHGKAKQSAGDEQDK